MSYSWKKMIKIINKKFSRADKHTFFCGRPSPLGNPWELKSEDDRDRVIAEYKIWIEDQLEKGNPRVMSALLEILNHHKEHGQVTLQCYCYPLNCHCNVIKDILEKLILT